MAALWTRNALTPANLAWLEAIPQGPLQTQHADVSLAHGSPLDEDQYIQTMRDAWAPLQQMPTAVTFFGHTHIQGGFSQREHQWHELTSQQPSAKASESAGSWSVIFSPRTRHLINPGSVGQPRDSDWRAAFAIFDTEACKVTFHRVPYDVAATQARIREAGLPERLAARLREGR